MKRPRKSYTHEFKIEAVQLLNERGKGLVETARELEVNRTMLARWRKEFAEDPEAAFPGSGRMNAENTELRELQKQLEQLQDEREILKKNGGALPYEKERIYRFIESNHKHFKVGMMCQIFGISRSAYYAWRKRPQSRQERGNGKLLAGIPMICQIFGFSRSANGAWRKRPQSRREQMSGKLPPEPSHIYRETEKLGGSAGIHTDHLTLDIHASETQAARPIIPGLQDLNPILRLTAALEAAGVDKQGFGFILRRGRYAPEGRNSDFLVGGLGLAGLSKHIVDWLAPRGPMDAQVQIVDDGSGEMVVYLLAK